MAVCNFVQSLISGNDQIGDTQLPAKMVLRQSCGCTQGHSESVEKDSQYKVASEMSVDERDELDSILNIMTRNIIGSFEESEIRDVLEKSLQLFDIANFSLSKYIDQQNSQIFYDTNGNVGAEFPSNFLVEKGPSTFPTPFYKFVLPLFYRNEDIGFFISDSGSKSLSVLEVLSDHLSGALKGAHLLKDVKKHSDELEIMVQKRTMELAKRSEELELALQNVKKANEKLEVLAVMDELTGLYNRRAFMTITKQNIALKNRKKSNVLLVFFDLDGLKQINDNYGHSSGDIAIKALADILAKTFRKSDIIARLGGDEFTVLAIDCTIKEYNIILERIDKSIEEYNLNSGYEFKLSVSCGAAPCKNAEKCTIEHLMEEADSELYKTKREKKRKNINC